MQYPSATDSQLWNPRQLIDTSWQEPLKTERGGYTITMREDAGAQAVLDRLDSSNDLRADRLHLGWGSFRNLDIAAMRQSRWALILDINIHQFHVWEAVLAALAESEDAEDFIGRAVERLPVEPRLRQFTPDTRAWLAGDCERRGSWLARHAPERFKHVRAMAREQRIALACLDMRGGAGGKDAGGGTQPFRDLAQWLEAARPLGGVPDTLYVSNVPWMLAQPKGFFGEDHGAQPEESWRRVRENLGMLASQFGRIVSAMHLAPHARMGDLQWETRLCEPAEFMDRANWKPLARAALAPESGFPPA